MNLHDWVKSFLARCEPDPESECIIYTGGDDGRRGGCYGRTRIPLEIAALLNCRGHKTAAHRASFVLYRGRFDTRLDLDHLCLVKMCVNPYHLEPVTKVENARRANIRKRELNRLRTFNPDPDDPLLAGGM